jgi:hypothetical protein
MLEITPSSGITKMWLESEQDVKLLILAKLGQMLNQCKYWFFWQNELVPHYIF